MADCNECGFVFTGVGCTDDVKVVSKIGVMRLVADDGTKNSIPLNFTPLQIKGLINNVDASKRLSIIDNIEDASFKPLEVATSTTPSGTIIKNNDFTPFVCSGKIYDVPTMYANTIKKLVSCGDYGVFFIDDLGAIAYSKKESSTDLFPRAIQKSSWLATQGDEKKGEVGQNVTFSFQEKNSEGLGTYAVAKLTSEALDELKGIEPLSLTIISASGTTVVAKAVGVYNFANSPAVYKDTTPTNFSLNPIAVAFNELTGNLTLTLATALIAGSTVSLSILGGGKGSNVTTFLVA